MNALIPLLLAISVFLLAYRYYSAFIGAKVLMLDNAQVTPANELKDGRDYIPTNKWIVFGQHFAAIAGAGPLIGPVLAAQYGWGPGFLWIVLGSVFAGAVHDMIILFASMRYKGQSISIIAKNQVGRLTGSVTAVIILFIIIITLAGVGLAVVNALYRNIWGTFAIAMTIPIAMGLGIYLFRYKSACIFKGSFVGVVLVCGSVFLGPYVAASKIGTWFSFDKDTLSLLLPIYGFFAAVLPVWLLLTPRGYLSTYMKIGIIFILAIGLFFAQPLIKMPFTTEFINGGGPIISGPWWPYVFIIIACGAISGFHALIGSGTTPKLVDKEQHIRVIGYGAMLAEGFVALMALIAVVTLHPEDYFAINAPQAVFEQMNIQVQQLPELSAVLGIDVQHRPGGAISLAVGMANIFASMSTWLKSTMQYWFQFIIMFEALFILTLIDAGTRVARYIFQDIFKPVFPILGRSDSAFGVIVTSALVSFTWGYLLYTGDISSIWPLFGATNQALAALALAICTTMLLKLCKEKRYVLITAVPCAFVFMTTMTASLLNLESYWNNAQWLNCSINVAVIIMLLIVMVDNVRCWINLLRLPDVMRCQLPAGSASSAAN